MKDWKQVWKDLAHKKAITSSDVYQRCLIKAVAAKSPEKEKLAVIFLQKAFTPITNPNRLKFGNEAYSGLFRASHCFIPDDLLTKQPDIPVKLLDCIETEEELAIFKKLNRTIVQQVSKEVENVYQGIEARNNALYSFVFIRQDISPEQQMVQGIHAGIKLGKQVDNPDTLNLVLCGAQDLTELQNINLAIERHQFHPIKTIPFLEADLNNELTAFCSTPISVRQKRRLNKFKLLKFNKENK